MSDGLSPVCNVEESRTPTPPSIRPANPHDPRPLLLCFSHLRWDFVYQRPQHLLSRAAKEYRVVFLEEPLFTPTGAPALDLADRDGIVVARPKLPAETDSYDVIDTQRALVDRLVTEFGGVRPPVLWYYTPMALAFSRHLACDVCVYDCMDELSAFYYAPPELGDLERELFTRADLVFTGGQSLFEAKSRQHPRVHLFASSIDKSHFAAARQRGRPEPEDQGPISRPRVGFFGVIDERMDLTLVDRLGGLRPDCQFVMIGPLAKIDAGDLPERPNIHWLGPKTYAELPAYLAGWDAGFMPFARNEATRFISPTKTPEFLAAGLPVVSTAITDVVRPYGELGLVDIAETPEHMAEKLSALLSRKRGPWLESVDRFLADRSWDRTWSGMSALLREAARPGYASVA